MSWGIRIFAVMLLAALLWVLFKPPSQLPKPVAATSGLVEQPSEPVRVTVYQQRGADGVPSFSDHPDRGQPHVIDHSKGTTYQSTYQGEVPNTASATYTPSAVSGFDPVGQLREDNLRMQQQLQTAKEQQMQRAIGQ
ncbi:MAG: hypothetical protein VXW65_15735 [Pseudomonadota bacterium]|nr:hypothetical protein [Pseudomonadota bacterium]